MALAVTRALFLTTLCFQHFSHPVLCVLYPTVNLTKTASNNHGTTRSALVRLPLPKSLVLDV